MGTGTRGRVRLLGVAGAALAVAATLTSCSAVLGAPGGAGIGTPSVTTVATPVAGSATPTATPTAAPSEAPVPTDTPSTPADLVTPTPTPAVDGTASVTPFITEADADGDALQVAAIVPGIAEAGGTCTVVAVSGATTRTATGSGVLAGAYTGCEAVKLTGLAPGTWRLTVRYASAAAAGTSAVRSVAIG